MDLKAIARAQRIPRRLLVVLPGLARSPGGLTNCRVGVALWCRGELGFADRAAQVVGYLLVRRPVVGLVAVDPPATNRIVKYWNTSAEA